MKIRLIIKEKEFNPISLAELFRILVQTGLEYDKSFELRKIASEFYKSNENKKIIAKYGYRIILSK